MIVSAEGPKLISSNPAIYIWAHNWIMLFLTNMFLSQALLLPASTSAERMVDIYDGIHSVVVYRLILQDDFFMDFVQKFYIVFQTFRKKTWKA